MSDPPKGEFSYGYGHGKNFNRMNNQEQQGDYPQKRSYPDDFQNNRGGGYNNRGNYRGNYNNNRGNYNNNRGNYNNNCGNYNNGNFNYSRGGGYINRGGFNNQNKKFLKGQSGTEEFNPKDFYHPGMLKDPWENL